MNKQVIIVGGVALGPKVAARLKRYAPETQITLIDRDNLISYGGCGIPYYVGGDVPDLNELRKTSYHQERNEKFFKKIKHINVMTRKEVTSINRHEKKIACLDLNDGQKFELKYDYLVLATGSRPVLPPLPGIKLERVFAVANLHHAQKIKELLTKGKVEKAVIVGAGAIGIEMAEAMADLWDVETTIVEMQDQILPAALGPDMAAIVQKELADHGVKVMTSTRVEEVLGNNQDGVQGIKTNQGILDCQLVIFSVGVKPNTDLAASAGLALGPHRGIMVDNRMRTSDPWIYAGGDCIEQRHLISGEFLNMPLGSLANRQGRVIGTNLGGGRAQFPGVVGSFCLKVFDRGVARAGLTLAQAQNCGFDPVQGLVVQADRAHFYPTFQLMYLKLIADRKTRQVLGVEALGPNGDAVKARVDAIAATLPYKPTLEDISNLEVCYSPPYAAAMDIVNSAANVLENIINGLHLSIGPDEFATLLKKQRVKVVDVRSPDLAQPYVEKYNGQWINIPIEQVEDRLAELPKNEPFYVFCNTGTTAFEAQRFYNYSGLDKVKSVQGSFAILRELAPELLPEKIKSSS